ncbi:hypothetical protein Pcinc_014089 [Petrolisthes cinctipes]|uniref:DDE Tnp4 domain-containing protein n=1 Tax=Petrolisthes cinctipes TaxID=88211 RepID=A0AAE1G114_PETCI|nr:hypothetical protein Pcinc_014089 [Petrolisthes cinctipes]
MAEQQPLLRVRQPWVFRERKDVLNELSDNELIKRYRLDREGIIFVTDLVRPVLLRPTVANKALTPEQKVIITLRAHKKTRSVVERGIGQWKRRFHVLHSEIRLTPTAKVCKIIFVCAVLHNICKDRNIQLLFEDDPGHDQPPAEDNIQMAANDDDDDQVEPPPVGYQARDGLPYREEFARLHFQ